MNLAAPHFDAVKSFSRLIPSFSLKKEEALILAALCKVGSLNISLLLNEITQEHDQDRLGDLYQKTTFKDKRQKKGITYTPMSVVNAMAQWGKGYNKNIVRIVDPGAGSGRLIFKAAKAFPDAKLVAIEPDPQAALILKVTAFARGLQDRLEIIKEDFRNVNLSRVPGSTLFISNPPYTRHHEIEPHWKQWYKKGMLGYGISASSLAGLHAHFLLKTNQISVQGDCGIFITASEWMDIEYGDAIRKLLVQEMGLRDLTLICQKEKTFANATVSSCFIGFIKEKSTNLPELRRITSATEFGKHVKTGGVKLKPSILLAHSKWTELTTIKKAKTPISGPEIGELFSVQRGQITGNNAIFISSATHPSIPKQFLIPTVTAARELIQAGEILLNSFNLKKVIYLPKTMEGLDSRSLHDVIAFLNWAKKLGADSSYTARHRSPWWHIKNKPPAAILCTYMARRPPHFTLNTAGASNINISHGFYPRENISQETLLKTVRWLNAARIKEGGRVYAGGLLKFEPKEIERIRLPKMENLNALYPSTVYAGTTGQY